MTLSKPVWLFLGSLLTAVACLGLWRGINNSAFESRLEAPVRLSVLVESTFNPIVPEIRLNSLFSITNRARILSRMNLTEIIDCGSGTSNKATDNPLCTVAAGTILVFEGTAAVEGENVFLKERAIKAGLELFLDSERVMLRGLLVKVSLVKQD